MTMYDEYFDDETCGDYVDRRQFEIVADLFQLLADEIYGTHDSDKIEFFIEELSAHLGVPMPNGYYINIGMDEVSNHAQMRKAS